jgi:hypothetical protein
MNTCDMPCISNVQQPNANAIQWLPIQPPVSNLDYQVLIVTPQISIFASLFRPLMVP